ncbi:MAG TPA: ester cyclase, partial [Gemmatimonadales bacterium]|nr:ester cyclase [Gemmatimonadales bacterium]
GRGAASHHRLPLPGPGTGAIVSEAFRVHAMPSTHSQPPRREGLVSASTHDVMTRYWDSDHRDVSMMAEDVVFTNMATGDEHRGPEAIRQLLDYMYRQAFDATAEIRSRICCENQAVLEAVFVGKHIGEFAGIPATGRSVRVPLCVVYDLESGRITQARVYLELPVLLRQLGQTAAAPAASTAGV